MKNSISVSDDVLAEKKAQINAGRSDLHRAGSAQRRDRHMRCVPVPVQSKTPPWAALDLEKNTLINSGKRNPKSCSCLWIKNALFFSTLRDMNDNQAGYDFYVGQGLPSDDVLEQEGRRLMEKVWKYGAIGMSREALIFIARDLRTGEIVTRPEFLSGSNKKRQWKRRKLR